MSQTNNKTAAEGYDVGRVFFQFGTDDEGKVNKAVPTSIRVIPLDCHVGNVKQLADIWRFSDNAAESRPIQTQAEANTESSESSPTQGKRAAHLSQSAKYHDHAKPKCFKLKYRSDKYQHRAGWRYSFSGHRFMAPAVNPYVDELIRGHHSFSVAEITTAVSKLKHLAETSSPQDREAWYFDRLAHDFLRTYSEDLYALEMSDQIEAELETRLLDPMLQGKNAPAPQTRNFMDFQLYQQSQESAEDQPVYRVAPFPFLRDSDDPDAGLSITYTYQDIEIPTRFKVNGKNVDLAELTKPGKQGPAPGPLLQSWLMQQLDRSQLQTRTLQLQPAFQDRRQARLSEKHYPAVFGFSELNAMQQAVMDRAKEAFRIRDNRLGESETDFVPDLGLGLLLRAPTGTGKTEAVLAPCLAHHRRLIMVLPARSLLDDHRKRIAKILQAAATMLGRRFDLVVDTGVETQQYPFVPVDQPEPPSQRRHLYKGDVILTTLDKMVYRYFGYGDKTKSMIFPYRLVDERTVFAFDEAHSYDGLAWTNFRMLVHSLRCAGRDMVLMTATMPKQMLEQFSSLDPLDAYASPIREKLDAFFKDLVHAQEHEFHPGKTLSFVDIALPEGEAPLYEREQAYEAMQIDALCHSLQQHRREMPRARAIVVVDTVRAAVALYQRLKTSGEFSTFDAMDPERAMPKTPLLLYHGRLADRCVYDETVDAGDACFVPRERRESRPAPRSTVYQKLKDLDDSATREPYVLITTQAIEVGCDLDADILLTMLANPASLIQRAGRCNRRRRQAKATLVVVGRHVPSYLPQLPAEKHEDYIADLQRMDGQPFEAEQIDPYTQHYEGDGEDPRLVELFDMLHRYVYEGDLLYEALHRKGLIVTRDWEPSVTLRIRKGALRYETSVPIRRLRIRQNEDGDYLPSPDVCVQQGIYDANDPNQKYHEIPLRGGDAHFIPEVIVTLPPQVQSSAQNSSSGAFFAELPSEQTQTPKGQTFALLDDTATQVGETMSLFARTAVEEVPTHSTTTDTSPGLYYSTELGFHTLPEVFRIIQLRDQFRAFAEDQSTEKRAKIWFTTAIGEG